MGIFYPWGIDHVVHSDEDSDDNDIGFVGKKRYTVGKGCDMDNSMELTPALNISASEKGN